MTQASQSRSRKLSRRPRIESLEKREMLTTYLVENPFDRGDIFEDKTLSWAIHQANTDATPGDDTINFSVPIVELQSDLGGIPKIHVGVTITGFRGSGSDETTILDADLINPNQGSVLNDDVFSIDVESGSQDVVIRNLDIINYPRHAFIVDDLSGNTLHIDNVIAIEDVSGARAAVRASSSGTTGEITIVDSFFHGGSGGSEGIGPEPAVWIETPRSIQDGNRISGQIFSSNITGFNGSVLLGAGVEDFVIDGGSFIHAPLGGSGTSLSAVRVDSTLAGVNVEPTGVRVDNAFLEEDYTKTLSAFDLKDNGPTQNDEDDTDNGPNGLLNTPIITSDIVDIGTQFQIPYSLDVGQPGDTDVLAKYEVEVYEFRPVSSTIGRYERLLTKVVEVTSLTDGAADFVDTFNIPKSLVQAEEAISLKVIKREVLLPDGITYGDADNSSSEFSLLSFTPSNAPKIDQILFERSSDNSVASRMSNTVPGGFQYRAKAGTFFDGIDRLGVFFNSPVQMINPNGARLVSESGGVEQLTMTWRTVNSSVTINLPRVLPNDKYSLEIDADAFVSNDALALELDGEWDLPIGSGSGAVDIQPNFDQHHLGETFLTGDGVSGGDFKVFFAFQPDTSTPIVATRLAGDYNDDERVNIEDYVVWVKQFGDSLSGPESVDLGNGVAVDAWSDGNNNGSVDAADYSVWRDNAGVNTLIGTSSVWAADYSPSSSLAFATGPIIDFNSAPRVGNVIISGSQSTHDPFSFDTVDGSQQQLATVPVGGADTVSITFTEDVNVLAEDLNLVGLLTANQPELAEFSYDLMTMTASWRFTSWALGDQYAISLSDRVTDIEGNRLDGEWINPSSLSSTSSNISAFPSGNGYAGGDFTFVATILPGDANLDGFVGATDLSTLSLNYGTQFNALFSDADFDGDGDIDLLDFNHLANNWGIDLTGPLELLADLDGDDDVDADDLLQFFSDYDNQSVNGITDADFDGDGDIDLADLDMLYAQIGVDLHTDLNSGPI